MSASLEGFFQKAIFFFVNPFIINDRKSIELFLEDFISLVGLDPGVRQMYEQRMQGECRVGVVRVGIRPCSCHRGVVDRQELDDALACERGPVNQFLEILELAHAEACLAAEGEHRDGSAGPAPRNGLELRDDIPYFQ